MVTKLTRWARTRTGRRAIAGILALSLVVLVAGLLLGWWPMLADSLRGTAGSQGVLPSQVVVTSFTAALVNDQVVLQWETESEVNNAGFNLYRSEQPGAPFVPVNGELIPSQAVESGGALYQLTEAPPAKGLTLEYRLESVDSQSLPTYHAATTVEIPAGSTPPQSGLPHQLFLPFIRH